MKIKELSLAAASLFTILVMLAGCQSLPGKNAFLTVEQTFCIGCGECVKVCQGDAIVLIGDKAIIDPAKCIQCGNCVMVCPNDAIH